VGPGFEAALAMSVDDGERERCVRESNGLQYDPDVFVDFVDPFTCPTDGLGCGGGSKGVRRGVESVEFVDKVPMMIGPGLNSRMHLSHLNLLERPPLDICARTPAHAQQD